MTIKSAVNKIKSKFIDFTKTDLEQRIDTVFDKIIDDISAVRDRLIITLKEHLKFNQVNYQEIYFLKVIETGEEDIFIDKNGLNEGF
jgi:hypothetical protein